MAGTRKRTTTTQEEVPQEQAQAEDVRAVLNDIDGPDEWLAEAYRLGMDRVRLHQRLPKSRAMPRRADLPKGTGGVEEIAEGECQKRNIPGGRFILLAMRRGRVVSRLEFDVGDPPDEFEPVATEVQVQAGDPSVEIAMMARDHRNLATIERLGAMRPGGAATLDPLATLKVAAEIMRPQDGGVKELVGPLLAANGALMQMIATNAGGGGMDKIMGMGKLALEFAREFRGEGSGDGKPASVWERVLDRYDTIKEIVSDVTTPFTPLIDALSQKLIAGIPGAPGTPAAATPNPTKEVKSMGDIRAMTPEQRANLDLLIGLLLKPAAEFDAEEFVATYEFCLIGEDGTLAPQAEKLLNVKLPMAIVQATLKAIDPRLATDEAIRNFDLARRWYKEYEEKAEVRGD